MAGDLPFDPLPALRRARRDEVFGEIDPRRGDRGVYGGDPEVLLGALVDRFADALGDVGASSSRLSNSEASEANSSLSSGRTFSRTSLMLTVKTASWPASCSAR